MSLPYQSGRRGRVRNERSQGEDPLADHNRTPRHEIRMVDVQDGDRGSADATLADQKGAIPAEMPIPAILTRVKKARDTSRGTVYPGDIRPLVAVTEEAGEGQVIRRG